MGWRSAGRFWRRCALVAGVLLASTGGLLSAAHAEEDPPGRVGRVAGVDGSGWMRDQGEGEWFAMNRNRPVTTGDWLSTDPGSRATVQIGSMTLRLDGGTTVAVQRLDDERVDLQVQAGAVSLRLRQPETINEVSVSWAEAVFQPRSTGLFVVRQEQGESTFSALSGEGQLQSDSQNYVVRAGQGVLLRPEAMGGGERMTFAWTGVENGDFAAWVSDQDLRMAVSQPDPAVSVEMTGVEDLDRYGRWSVAPDYGRVWMPAQVAPGWAPYRYGHWAWVSPWGWTWVDDAPWGFAPFHYGRWVYWSSRWAWVPGPYVRRPVYAPALVAWVGSSGWSVSVSSGPTVGWVPLAPWEAYRPVYVVTPGYARRVNPWEGHPPPRYMPPPRAMAGRTMPIRQHRVD